MKKRKLGTIGYVFLITLILWAAFFCLLLAATKAFAAEGPEILVCKKYNYQIDDGNIACRIRSNAEADADEVICDDYYFRTAEGTNVLWVNRCVVPRTNKTPAYNVPEYDNLRIKNPKVTHHPNASLRAIGYIQYRPNTN